MIKIANFLTLLIFLNFTTLPSMFALVSWDLPTSHVVFNEEEINDLNLEIDVKPSPTSFNLKYLLKFSTFQNLVNFILQKKISSLCQFISTYFHHLPTFPSNYTDFFNLEGLENHFGNY